MQVCQLLRRLDQWTSRRGGLRFVSLLRFHNTLKIFGRLRFLSDRIQRLVIVDHKLVAGSAFLGNFGFLFYFFRLWFVSDVLRSLLSHCPRHFFEHLVGTSVYFGEHTFGLPREDQPKPIIRQFCFHSFRVKPYFGTVLLN